MSSQLNSPQDLSPASVPVDPPLTNALTVNFGTRDPGQGPGSGDWVSEPISVPGVPGAGGGGAPGAGSVAFLLDFTFGGATSIEVLPEHAPPPNAAGDVLVDGDFYPLGRLDASANAENDVVALPAATFPGQTKLDLNLQVPASHWIRLRARALGGAGATLAARAVAGRA